MNTKKQGDAGLGKAIAYFTSLGFTVSIPLTDSQDYDLIVDFNDRLNKIQVKSTTYKRYNSYQVSLTIKGGNRTSVGKIKPFDNTKVDFVFIYTPDSVYLIPANAILGDSISLCEKYEMFRVYF